MIPGPAVGVYNVARNRAIEHGDYDSATHVGIRVVERFEFIGNLASAFKWAKIAGDQGVLYRVGTKTAKWHEWRADSFDNGLFSNELAIGHHRNAVETAAESGNVKLAREMGVRAAERFKRYGDSCVNKPGSRNLGFSLGHVRAVRWLEAIGEKGLAKRARDDVVRLYKANGAVNTLTLAVAVVIGDRLQTELVGAILASRKG